jgi:hypothetical protein
VGWWDVARLLGHLAAFLLFAVVEWGVGLVLVRAYAAVVA